MAKSEFLGNFRIARNLFMHHRVEADSPPVQRASAEPKLARAAIWLTPKSMKGFEASDFSELGEQKLGELQDAVREFTEVASQVPAAEAATPEQLKTATEAFLKVLTILQPYLRGPEEGRKVEEAIETVPFPDWVVNWDYELANDSDGMPSIYFYFFVDEQNVPRGLLGKFASELTMTIRTALAARGVERWPYIRVRTAAEHKAV